jgi:hypothetical protein
MGVNMTRSLEELINLPLAVILDEELPILVQGCKEVLDMELMKVVIKGRGLEDKFPELMI